MRASATRASGRFSVAICVVVGLAGLVACGGESGDEGSDPASTEPEPAAEDDEPGPGAEPGGDRDDDEVRPPSGAGDVSFSRDIVPLFEASCGTRTSGCHTREAYVPAADNDCRGWLTLEDAPLGSVAFVNGERGEETGCPDLTLHERLLGLDAWMCGPPAISGGKRVRYIKAGSPQGSHLYNILGGNPTEDGSCEKAPGEPTSRMPLEPLPLLADDKIELIERWIRAGAPDN